MSTHNRNAVIVGIVIIVILILGFFAWKERETTNASIPTTTATTTQASSTTNVTISSNGQITAPPGYTITPIYATSSGPVAPNYKAPLVFAGDVPSDQQSQIQGQYEAAVSAITQNSTDFNAWIELGDAREEAGDYQGATADWQYMSYLYPTNTVSNANLGDLYTNYLPNYSKAASAYQAQIKNDPTDVYIYVNLYNLYTNQYPQSTTTIVALLKQGLTANPGNAQLESLLAKYQ